MEGFKAFRDLLDFFAEGKWSVLKDHFYPCVTLVILGVGLTYLFYQERIANLKEQVASYQIRLGEIPKETVYTTLTNADLKREAYKLAGRLRDLQQATMKDRTERLRNLEEQRGTVQSDEQRKAFSQQYQQVLEESLAQEQERFQREFIGLIRAISATIRGRLPSYEKRYDDLAMDIIMDTTILYGASPIGEVASTLEKQAEQLPTTLGDWFSLRWQDTLFTLAVLTGAFFFALHQYALWHTQKFSQPTAPPSGTVSPAVASQNKGAQKKLPHRRR